MRRLILWGSKFVTLVFNKIYVTDPANGDFHLQSGSPCIDTGNNSAPSIPAEDFEGDNRIIDGDGDSNAVVDMGADEYHPIQYTLTVQKPGTGTGTVTSNPAGIDCGGTCSAPFNEGTAVTLTAQADAGSEFGGWGGDCQNCGQAGQCQITIDSDKDCTATFDLQTHTVTPSVGSGQGSIDPSTPQTVNYNETVHFTLTPDQCYHIDGVGGTCGGTLNGNQFTTNPVTQDCSVVANFAIDTYTITASAGAGGSINPSGDVAVNCGADQSFTITPDAGYWIDDVVVDGQSVGARNSYTFSNITSNHTIQASFSQDDGDGVDTSVENGAPNGGDGNGDGVPDSQQKHVSSFRAGNGDYVTFATNSTYQFWNVRRVSPPPDAPQGIVFPYGMFSFEIINASGEATVKLYLPRDTRITGYWKKNRNTTIQRERSSCSLRSSSLLSCRNMYNQRKDSC